MGNPSNWQDWKPCKLCKILQAPRALGEDGCCKDMEWCLKHKAAAKPPTNGTHHPEDTNVLVAPPEMGSPKPTVTEITEIPVAGKKRPKKRKK